jgi:hypothetical protein
MSKLAWTLKFTWQITMNQLSFLVVVVGRKDANYLAGHEHPTRRYCTREIFFSSKRRDLLAARAMCPSHITHFFSFLIRIGTGGCELGSGWGDKVALRCVKNIWIKKNIQREEKNLRVTPFWNQYPGFTSADAIEVLMGTCDCKDCAKKKQEKKSVLELKQCATRMRNGIRVKNHTPTNLRLFPSKPARISVMNYRWAQLQSVL